MLKDIFRYNVETDNYVRRLGATLWKVWVTETEGIKRIEEWSPLLAITPSTYSLYERGEKSERIMYVEAQDELEAFAKAMKMQEEKNGRLDAG